MVRKVKILCKNAMQDPRDVSEFEQEIQHYTDRGWEILAMSGNTTLVEREERELVHRHRETHLCVLLKR